MPLNGVVYYYASVGVSKRIMLSCNYGAGKTEICKGNNILKLEFYPEHLNRDLSKRSLIN